MAVIGIDLGTTNSLGAVFRDGQVELIPNRFGSYLTPSVVSLGEGGEILVGEVAKERLVTHPKQSAASFKKDMGTKKAKVLGNKKFLPEELSSFVIRSIVEDAELYLKEEIEEAIISVPAYFHDKQRVATKQAGTLAGVTVKRIINEPSAAALASYFHAQQEQIYLIFDFGGGTFDISIVECFDTMVEILSVSGDNHLGGDDFHEIMVEAFLAEHGLIRNAVTDKEYAVLLRRAEICKQRLTAETAARMSAVFAGRSYLCEFTNRRLMDESAVILGKIKKVMGRALEDSGLAMRDIDVVVMVGGSSKMPLIQSYLRHLFQQAPFVVGNCDEMVVRGLGILCAVKERDEAVRDYVLTDICPFTLGTSVFNRADAENCYMAPIIERNTVLPCSKVRRFYTVFDNQTKIDISILQGEHPYADDNLCLEKMCIRVPGKKSGEESVDLRFTYDINGILIGDITVVSTGKTVSRVISQDMDEREIEYRMRELERLKVHPKDISENRLMLERLKSLYEEVPTYMREQVRDFIVCFDRLLSEQNPRQIQKYLEFLEQTLEQYESYDPFEHRMEFDAYNDADDAGWDEDDAFEVKEEDDRVWTS